MLHRVHQEHPPRLQPALLAHVLRRHLDHAHLRRQHHQIVLGHDVPPRPQPVAVQRRANHAAVGETHRRRPVPRLHQRRVVLVERALLRVHLRIARPRLGNQHGHHMGQRSARLEEELHRIVDRSRVASARRNHRIQLVDLAVVERALHHRLARAHPADVAADGVDLAVVRHVAVRMRQLPTGKCVGRKSLMHQAQGARHQRIGQLVVELLNLRRQHQALVDDRAAGERRNVEVVLVLDLRLRNLVLRAATYEIQQPLEGVLLHPLRPSHEHLLDVRLRRARLSPDQVAIHRRIAPAQQLQPLGLADALQHPFAL